MNHRKTPRGQASVEYVLILTVVFIAFAGVSAIFSRQIAHYLSFLLDIITSPF